MKYRDLEVGVEFYLTGDTPNENLRHMFGRITRVDGTVKWAKVNGWPYEIMVSDPVLVRDLHYVVPLPIIEEDPI